MEEFGGADMGDARLSKRLIKLADRLPVTRLVYVADREADILKMMQRAHTLGHPADYLLCAQHDRCLPQGGKSWPVVLATTPVGKIEFTLPERAKRPARRVRQTLHVLSVDLPDGHGGLTSVTCLVACETGAPQGQKAFEWRLLTNRAVATLEDAAQLIDWYRCRWEIETLFHVLKNGCRVESLQFGDARKLELALEIYLVVTWRLAHLTRLARTDPELPASVVFEQTDWQAVWLLAEKPTSQEDADPARSDQSYRYARRLPRPKGDGEPGVETLWQGFARLSRFVRGVEQMHSIHAG